MSKSTNQAIGSIAEWVPGVRAHHGKQGALSRLPVWVFVFLVASCMTVRGQRPESVSEHAPPQPPATPAAAPPGVVGEVDPTVLRAETLEKLKALQLTPTTQARAPAGPATAGTASAPSASAAAAAEVPTTAAPSSDHSKKSLPALLQDRLRWLNEFEAANVALQKATHPEPSPAQQAAEANSEIARMRNILSLAAQNPAELLPPAFRGKPAKVSVALASEMKDAIETTSSELKDWKTKWETLNSEIEKCNGLKKASQGQRDSLFQRVTALTAKSREYKSAVTDAQTAAERRLATERLTNFEWEWRVESLRLKVIEAQLALEQKLAEVRDLKLEVCRAHVTIAAQTLEPMQERYSVVAADQERDLTQAKTNEENKARSSDDPIEQFRARSTAELLAIEALVVRNEQALVVSPKPRYDDQRTLADRADFDFANIKELLEDGTVSRLDAVRLNNEFRRIGPERDRLIKDEMAAVESQLQYYENTLTSVELELLQDSHDRFEHDLQRERLPMSRWGEREALIEELARKHKALLRRRQRALEKLSEAASHTLAQVNRRLGILDQEYGFIRTNIFWVRDREPIGLLTLTQGAREFNMLVRGLVRLVREVVNPKQWGQPSIEFVVIAMMALLLPVGLVWLRRMLGARIKRDLPAPQG
jgi:hypothetical protein